MNKRQRRDLGEGKLPPQSKYSEVNECPLHSFEETLRAQSVSGADLSVIGDENKENDIGKTENEEEEKDVKTPALFDLEEAWMNVAAGQQVPLYRPEGDGSLPGLFFTVPPLARFSQSDNERRVYENREAAARQKTSCKGQQDDRKRKFEECFKSSAKHGNSSGLPDEAPPTKKSCNADGVKADVALDKTPSALSNTEKASEVSRVDPYEYEMLKTENAKFRKREELSSARINALEGTIRKLRASSANIAAQQGSSGQQSPVARERSFVFPSRFNMPGAIWQSPWWLPGFPGANTFQSTTLSTFSHRFNGFGLRSSHGVQPTLSNASNSGSTSLPPSSYLRTTPNKPTALDLGDIVWAPDCSPALNPYPKPGEEEKHHNFNGFAAQGCIRPCIVGKIHDSSTWVAIWIESAGNAGPNMKCKPDWKKIFRVISVSDKKIYSTTASPENNPITACMKAGSKDITPGSYADISRYCTMSFSVNFRKVGMLAPDDKKKFLEAFNNLFRDSKT